MGTIIKTTVGTWRAQVRRKGKYASQTFKLKTLADVWVVETERLIDLGGEPSKRQQGTPRTVADLVDLHMSDLQEVGRPLRRSKHAVMRALKRDLGATRLSELDHAVFGKRA